MRIIFAIGLLVASLGFAPADTRWIEGAYRNPALGYAIEVPRGLKGMTGDQAGPERGLGITLPSGGKIVVFGEPNSLEWKSPEEGIRGEISFYKCAPRQEEVKPARIGNLRGAQGTIVCGDRVLKLFLAFRTSGGPVYELRLETVRTHEFQDEAILDKVVGSFKLIRWE